MTPSSASLHWEAQRTAVMAKGNVSSAHIYIDKAEGALLWDIDGREYIDFSGGIGGICGGNPVACAAALAVSDIFESENLLARAQNLGANLRAHFDASGAQ